MVTGSHGRGNRSSRSAIDANSCPAQTSVFLPICRPSLVSTIESPARSQMHRFFRQIYSYSRSPLPLPLFNRHIPPVRPPFSARMQSLSHRSRRLYNHQSPPDYCSPLMLDNSNSPTDYSRESFPPESPIFDSEQLLFDMDDGRRHDPSLAFPWDATGALPTTRPPPQSVTASPASSASLLDFGSSPPSSDLSFTPGSFPGLPDINSAYVELEDRNLYSNWLVDDLSAAPSASVPIIVSSAPSDTQPPPPQTTLTQYVGVGDHGLTFPKMDPSSPSLEYASVYPFSRSVERSPMGSISPPQISQPSWAAQLWSHADTTGAGGSPLPQLLHPPDESDNFATQRPQRGRINSLPVHAIFQSSSAPSGLQAHTPQLARGYSRRAESVSTDDDHDATVRRKRKVSDAGASMSRQAEGDILFHDNSVFPLTRRMIDSSAKVTLATSQVGSFRMAALLYRLDSATSGVQHSQT